MHKQLEQQLIEAGISVSNKGIQSYAANGTEGSYAIRNIYKACENLPIEPKNALAFALNCGNRHLNGGHPPGFRDGWHIATESDENQKRIGSDWPMGMIDILVNHTDLLLDSYSRMRQETINYYRKAIDIIDAFKGAN